MRKTKLFAGAMAAVMAMTCFAACGAKAREITRTEKYNLRGEQLLQKTVEKYFDAEELFCIQYYGWEEELDGPADIWHYSSLQEAAQYYLEAFPDKKEAQKLEKDLMDGLAYYAEDRTGFDDYTVYGLYRTMEPNSNDYNFDLYDDNSCIIRNYIHNYRLTGDEETLATAKHTMEWIYTNGWDTSINPETGEAWGGNPQGPASANYYKPICANEIVCTDLLQFSELATDPEEKAFYLDWATKYYDFCVRTFRLDNNLYGDYVGCERVGDQTISQGVVARETYTYHQGAMIEAGVRMYQATGEEIYLTQAKETAIASRAAFGSRDIIEGMYQLPFNIYHWFNLLLVRGYIMLAEIDESFNPFIDEIAQSLDYAYDNFYRDGLLPSNFLQGWIDDYVFDEKVNIMDAAAYAQYYFMLAAHYDEEK